MQNHVKKDNFDFTLSDNSLLKSAIKDAIGVTSPFSLKNSKELTITEKQIEILEDAIKRYERLEDIKKFSKIALEDMETVTEEDIKRALELEEMVSIEDEKAVLNLIQNEGFLWDLESADFSEILNNDNKQEYSSNTEKPIVDADFGDFFVNESEDDFSDFDFDPKDS